MKLIVIAHCLADITDGQMGQLQQLRGFCHAVIQQKILGGPPHGVFENFAEITAVQAAVIRDILHGNIVLEILFDKCQRFVNVKVPDLSHLGGGKLHGRDGAGQ